MATMGAVGKGGKTNYGEKFEYHKIDDVDAALRVALVEHGVVATLVSISDRKMKRSSEMDKYNNLRTVYCCECLVTIKLVNADDPEDTTSIVGWGQGLDYGDKATGKAISYAAKAAYLSSFHLRGQPDNEADNMGASPIPVKEPLPKPEAKPSAAKAAKPTVKQEEPVVLPDYDSLSVEVQTWINACRTCDDMDMLRGLEPGLKEESESIKKMVMPFFEEQKKVCWAFEINKCKTIPELNAVGKAIADDKNKSLHTALHAVYGAKVKSLKEGLKGGKNDN